MNISESVPFQITVESRQEFQLLFLIWKFFSSNPAWIFLSDRNSHFIVISELLTSLNPNSWLIWLPSFPLPCPVMPPQPPTEPPCLPAAFKILYFFWVHLRFFFSMKPFHLSFFLFRKAVAYRVFIWTFH